MKQDLCLSCKLADCDEKHPDCLLENKQSIANKKYYLKIKDTSLYRKNKLEYNKKWRSTDRGKRLLSEQAKRYRLRYPEKVREIHKRYYEKNKKKILLRNKLYKIRKKQKELPS